MARRNQSPKQRALDRLPAAPVNRESLRETLSLFAFVLPYRPRFFLGLTALFTGTLLALCFPFLAGSLIDAATNPLHRAPGVVSALDLNHILFLMLGLIVLQAGAAIVNSFSFNHVGQRALADLRRAVYSRLVGMPMAFFAQRRVGELTSRVSTDIAQIESMLTDAFPQLCRQTVFLLGGLALITATSPKLTVVMLSVIPLLIVVAVVFGRRIRKLSRDAQDRLAETNTVVEETFQAIASVKAFANEAFEIGRYQRAVNSVLATALGASRWRALFIGFIIFAIFGGIGIVMWFGARLLQGGEITAGQLTRFVLYTTFVAGAMSQAAELFSQLQKTVGATQRVRELLRETPEISDPLAIPLPPPELVSAEKNSEQVTNAVKKTGPRLRGEVAFENLSFRYPSRPEVAVLHDVSLHASPGEKIALVGPSGAGKSTLTSLLLRFYDPEGGRILIDGRDAREYPLAWLRGQMAIVPQDVLLFGGTIMENINYGRPKASPNEVREAARLANADEFIRSFPEGYDTLVGDRGIKLSGGQRQRVAIARAILKDPAILILDEATSSLDSESERLVQAALETLMKGRTTFIVAHRLATIRSADRIAVIQSGRVVEQGTHEELVAQTGGLYQRLSALQFDLTESPNS